MQMLAIACDENSEDKNSKSWKSDQANSDVNKENLKNNQLLGKYFLRILSIYNSVSK